MVKKTRLNQKNLLSLILLIFLFMFNRDTLLSYFNSFPIDWSILFFLFSFFLYVSFDKKPIFLIEFKTKLTYFLFLASIIFTIILNNDYSGGYFLIILIIITSFFFNSIIKRKFFYTIFIFFSLFISTFSIVSRLIYVIDPIFIETNFLVVTNSENVSFYNLFFSFLVNYVEYFRIFGIYREPGVFAFILIISLIFNLFFFKFKYHLLINLILLTGIILTGSTPGYLSMGIILFAYLYNYLNSLKKVRFIYIFLVPLISFFTFFYFSEVILEAFSKISFENSSLVIRFFSILSNFQVGLSNPIYGMGIKTGLGDLYRSLLSLNLSNFSYSSIDNTSTHGAMFATFGILFPVLFITLNFRFSFSFSKNYFVSALIFLAILFSLNSQLYLYSEFSYLLFFSSLNHINNL